MRIKQNNEGISFVGSEEEIVIRNDIESKTKSLLLQLERYFDSIKNQNELIVSLSDIVDEISINSNIIEVKTIIPIASCKCDRIERISVENSIKFLYVYHITCDCIWEEGKQLSFYGFCYKLNATQNENRIKVSFSSFEDIRRIFYWMSMSEIEYRVNWLIENYSKMREDINKNLQLNLEKNMLLSELRSKASKFKKDISKNSLEIDRFYEENRYEPDHLIWQRKVFKQEFEHVEEELNTQVWAINSEIRKIRIPEFIEDKEPIDKHVVCFDGKDSFYCF